ncbi:penicillin-binding protein 2 [Coxiella endosymbiont of Amblyomma americanum]|uniref:penicillin-binding protein 2 n=1 Tax=Coxiella endosymbiont of Amblyomma americanum TaxID=325775 RepID=UPI00057EBE6A|nr:penicillin-binding protein 2 [Coxiella endosymbiont of Amblyomma americanum]AUJ58969.1 penicillin-binding protein 2 [Coxiella-like endosymbiont of Amblyomma americanum]
MPPNNTRLEAQLFKNRSFSVFLLIILFIFVLIGQLSFLQIKNHHFYSTLAKRNLLSIIPVHPDRGLIFDRYGIPLASNIPIYTLMIIPSNYKNFNETVKQLSKIISIPREIKKVHSKLYRYHPYPSIPIKYKLTDEEIAHFYVNSYRFPNVRLAAHMVRCYPFSDTVSNVLGYVGQISPSELQKVDSSNYTSNDITGKAGIEKYYEKQLHGKIGFKTVEINANNRIVRVLKTTLPMSGNNIYLTIDSALQTEVKKILGNENGAVVIIQPGTGQVLALVTNPSFNTNLLILGLSQKQYQKFLCSPKHLFYNRAIQGEFSPGSTIKPFLALIGLDKEIITSRYQIYDPGWFKLPNTHHIYHDWKSKGHGWINVKKAIIVSCDVYFYNLAVMLGIYRIDDILHRFGFGSITGIDLPEEVSGLLPSPNWKMKNRGYPWYTGDTIETGIGQGFFLVTPLQLAQAVSILAERGRGYRPSLLLKVVTPTGRIQVSPSILRSPVILKNPHNWDIIIHAMQDVVDKSWGSAQFFGRHPGFSVAAKTGTAQIYKHQREDKTRYNVLPKRLRNNHLFVAFAPVTECPKIAIAVVVEHSALADKITGKIMQYYFEHAKNINHK